MDPSELSRGYYIGLDVRKETITYSVKDASGQVHREGQSLGCHGHRAGVLIITAIGEPVRRFRLKHTEIRTLAV